MGVALGSFTRPNLRVTRDPDRFSGTEFCNKNNYLQLLQICKVFQQISKVLQSLASAVIIYQGDNNGGILGNPKF